MLSFLALSVITHYADSAINSCSEWSSSTCTINCDGSPYCVDETINCFSNRNCKVQCKYNDDRRRLLSDSNRNLLAYACSGDSYGCCNSVINCPAGKTCEVDCTDGCSDLTINAQESTYLYIKDCNADNNNKNNCQYMNIYCPKNGRGGTTDRCEIQGDSNGDDLENVNIYTEEGLRDLKIDTVDTSGTTLYCGRNYEHSCTLNANGDGCASGQPTTCVNYLLPTAEPTADPSKAPTPGPTDSTSDPSISPTKFPSKFPTKTPTTTPTRAPSKTPTDIPTKNPTFTYDPSTDPTISPTKYPSIPPTPRPVRSGHAADSQGEYEDDDTEVSIDETNINIGKGNSDDNQWVIWTVVAISIIVLLFFVGVLYFVVAKRRQLEQEYGDDFRKVQSEMMVYHTIPGASGDFGGAAEGNLSVPKPKPRPKNTMTMTGEHMEYNEIYGDNIAPLEEEDEFEVEQNNQMRLYYKKQFMELLMNDPQQQAYLMTLDEITRGQYIEEQCNLYLQRVEDMARRKTLPIQVENAPTSDDESIIDGINNNTLGDDDDDIIDAVNTKGGGENENVTAGGIDVDEMDSDESIDEINNKNVNDESVDEDIVKVVDTQQGINVLPNDMEADPYFD